MRGLSSRGHFLQNTAWFALVSPPLFCLFCSKQSLATLAVTIVFVIAQCLQGCSCTTIQHTLLGSCENTRMCTQHSRQHQLHTCVRVMLPYEICRARKEGSGVVGAGGEVSPEPSWCTSLWTAKTMRIAMTPRQGATTGESVLLAKAK